jgi:hypothetical protein
MTNTNIGSMALRPRDPKHVHVENESKQCTKCGVTKRVVEFHKRRLSSDGHEYVCKQCKHEYRISYYEANRLLILEKQRQYRADNQDRVRESKKAYRDSNPDRVRASREKHRSQLHVKEKTKIYNKLRSINRPEIKRAQKLVATALANGSLVRLPCSMCGSEISEAHHPDYLLPLYVVWLCPKHHTMEHVRLRQQGAK